MRLRMENRFSLRGRDGFTLVELVTAMGVIALLLGLLLPSLSAAREQAKSTVCRSNIRQLASANDLYALDQGGVYVPGAADFLANLHRWHGARASLQQSFDPRGGPLVDYLGEDRAIRACPDFEPPASGFEVGNGGYGYNNAYLGVALAEQDGEKPGAIVVDDRRGAYVHRVIRPSETIMFADSAFAESSLIEYSFAEPRFHPQFGNRADPSIHFRHARRAEVAWCDGHVSAETRTFTWSSGLYEGNTDRLNLGWFGASDDNSLFDLR